MEYNKVYFSIYYNSNIPPNNVFVNDGLQILGFNMRRQLGDLYNKFNAFSIKLEAYTRRHNNTSVPSQDFFCFHIAGLNFINGFDSSTKFNHSRVLEVLDFSITNATNPTGFISNCNSTMFYKPSSDYVDLLFFYSTLNDETLVNNTDGVYYIFSITGLDAFKIPSPQKQLITRLANTNTINFTLHTRNAEIIDSRRRAFRFNNVNLRNIIGNIYDKYSKFILITRYFTLADTDTNYQTGTASQYFALYLSGLAFISLSRAQYFITTDIRALGDIFQSTPVNVLCSTFGITRPCEYYIENGFYKSSERVNLTFAYTAHNTYSLSGANGATTTLFPHFTINFSILPIID